MGDWQTFTGTTQSDMRRRILQQWADGEIDIVIGTSALGLASIRTMFESIVHATIPENVDRFYQEVGRSGRDGFSAASLVCATATPHQQDDDVSQAYSLLPKLITIEKALPRWQAMVASSTSEAELDWISPRRRPPGRDDMRAGERNRDWNDHLLLLMQRAGLIEVADAPPPIRVRRARSPISFLSTSWSRGIQCTRGHACGYRTPNAKKSNLTRQKAQSSASSTSYATKSRSLRRLLGGRVWRALCRCSTRLWRLSCLSRRSDTALLSPPRLFGGISRA